MSVLHLHVHCMSKPSLPIKKAPSNTGLTIGHEPTSQAGRVDRGDTKVPILSANHTSRVQMYMNIKSMLQYIYAFTHAYTLDPVSYDTDPLLCLLSHVQ